MFFFQIPVMAAPGVLCNIDQYCAFKENQMRIHLVEFGCQTVSEFDVHGLGFEKIVGESDGNQISPSRTLLISCSLPKEEHGTPYGKSRTF